MIINIINNYQKTNFETSTLKDDLRFLKTIGEQLIRLNRYDITKTDVLFTTENFFNLVFEKLLKDDSISENLRDKFIDLRSEIMELCEMIDQKKLKKKLFKGVTNLGKDLIEFSDIITSIAIPLLIITQTANPILN